MNARTMTILILASLAGLATVPTSTATTCTPLDGTLELVCASAYAWASTDRCINGLGVPYDCWSGGGGGSVSAYLGLVTGQLSGSANTVPLADACVSPGVSSSCSVSDGAYEYPGPAVVVALTVTATTVYGIASEPASASA